MKKFLLLSLGFLLTNVLFAQEILEATLSTRYTSEDIEGILGFQGINYDVDYYNVSYITTGTDGNPDTAGAVVAVPDLSNGSSPFLIYHHGTVNNRFDVPSLGSNESRIGLLFGGLGYITLVPDYIGMSSSRGYHPYLHVETQARSSTDLLIALRDYFDEEAISYQTKVFLTGYSQGGHASASTHFELQENPIPDFEVVAASHLSGPYSLSEVMWDFILSDETYLTAAYIPHLLLGMQEAYGNLFNSLDQVFKSPYAGIISELYNDAGLFSVNQDLVTQLFLNEGRSVPKLMIQDSVVNNMTSNENHPIVRALRDNDLSTWVPQCPTRLVYCMADEQVNYRNAVVTDSIMNALGALDVESIDVAPDQDHGGCVTPALLYTVGFFGPYFTTDNEELLFENEWDIDVYTNNHQEIVVRSDVRADGEIYLRNVQGQVLDQRVGEIKEHRFNGNYSGLIFVTVKTSDQQKTFKVLLNK